jgi:hypothetical protein
LDDKRGWRNCSCCVDSRVHEHDPSYSHAAQYSLMLSAVRVYRRASNLTVLLAMTQPAL